MTTPSPRPKRKPPTGRDAVVSGYRKGEEARSRILAVALQAFGRDGYRAATTRRIADEAGVTLPALQYYFGGKEALYRECAVEIANRYAQVTSAETPRAIRALADGASPDAFRAILKELIRAITGLMTVSEETHLWNAFVARELNAPGPAFDILYDRLWHPGIELTAALMARIAGDAVPTQSNRMQAMLLISGINAFYSGRNVAMRSFGWRSLGADELAEITAAIDAQIDRL